MKTRRIRYFLIAIVTLAIAFLYGNCSDVEFSQPSSNNTPKGNDDVDVVIANCDDAARKGELKTQTYPLNFADSRVESGRAKVCLFKSGDKSDDNPDINGNYTMKNDYLRSRYEQSRPLAVPSNAVLCAMKIEAPKQSFHYDDMFYFTFNDYILASSLKKSFVKPGYSYETKTVGSKTLNLYKYNWTLIANSTFTGVNETANDYCLGEEDEFGKCAWPLSQAYGEINLTFDPEVAVPLGLQVGAASKEFGFIVTGDNDPDVDCYHQNLDLNVTISYYEK